MNALLEKIPCLYFGRPFQTYDIFSATQLSKQHKLLLSAGIAASITSSMYNSLDCLRVRWQTLPQEPKFQRHFSSRGLLFFTRYIIQKEGFVHGLCKPGMFISLIAGGCTTALRFGFYENIRDSIYSASPHKEKNGVHMFFAGLSCGGIAYFLTTPLQVMKTKIQANQNNALYNLKHYTVTTSRRKDLPLMFSSKGSRIIGLWNGSSTVTARGALFSAGQMLGYDGFKTFCKSNDIIEDGLQLHIASSVVAAFCSTSLSTPADVVLSRYVISPSSRSIIECIKIVHKVDGIPGFWRGSGLAFMRLCPVILSYSMLYEQLRKQFGLGYLT